jgi:hypothetical protein
LSNQLVQIIEITGLAICAIVLVLLVSIKQLLSFRYTMGWILLCTLTILGALVTPFIEPISEFLWIEPFAVIGAICLYTLSGICIQLSFSISGIQRHISRLNEELALLRNKTEIGELYVPLRSAVCRGNVW